MPSFTAKATFSRFFLYKKTSHRTQLVRADRWWYSLLEDASDIDIVSIIFFESYCFTQFCEFKNSKNISRENLMILFLHTSAQASQTNRVAIWMIRTWYTYITITTYHMVDEFSIALSQVNADYFLERMQVLPLFLTECQNVSWILEMHWSWVDALELRPDAGKTRTCTFLTTI